MELVYEDIQCCDFSLSSRSKRIDLAILSVQDQYWNDLGDPRRVYETLVRMQIPASLDDVQNLSDRNDSIREPLQKKRKLKMQVSPNADGDFGKV